MPLLLIRAALHIKSGIINLDFFLLTLLACLGSPGLALALFIATYVLELARLLDALYYFSGSDPLFALRFLGHVRPSLVLTWAAAFVVVCAVGFLLWKAAVPRPNEGPLKQSALAVGIFLMLLLGFDRANGFEFTGAKRHIRIGYRAVDEVLLRVPLSIARPAPVLGTVAVTGSASAPLWLGQFAARQDNVVVVLVESMGRLLDAGDAQQEFALFQDPAVAQRYTVTTGSVPFTGSTVAGEMRELCRLRTGMTITADTVKGHPLCLPGHYRDAGYQALAFHGFRASMFQRSAWYPLLGFTGETFLADMPQLPTCEGAFYGVCDGAVAGVLQQRLRARATGALPPQFLYWMTLNSHLPVNQAAAPKAACPVAADRHVCAQLAYVQAVLVAVKTLALDPAIGRTAIVIVGDHAPPFLIPRERDRFDGKRVPFVFLQPR